MQEGTKTVATVTTMPSTGQGPESGSTLPAAGIFAALAFVLATLASVTPRLIGARATRR